MEANEQAAFSMRKRDSCSIRGAAEGASTCDDWLVHVRARLDPYPISDCSVALLRIAVLLVRQKRSLNDLRFPPAPEDRQRTMARSSGGRLIDAECRCLLDRTERDGWDGSVILRLKANSPLI
jgi:hypothetical protein